MKPIFVTVEKLRKAAYNKDDDRTTYGLEMMRAIR